MSRRLVDVLETLTPNSSTPHSRQVHSFDRRDAVVRGLESNSTAKSMEGISNMGGQKSSSSFRAFHSFSKSFSLTKLDDWKDKNVLNESEHSITKSLVIKALKIKAIQLEQHVTTSTTASVPRTRTRHNSIHSQYEWTQYGKDVTKQDVDEDQLADGCCSFCTNCCCFVFYCRPTSSPILWSSSTSFDIADAMWMRIWTSIRRWRNCIRFAIDIHGRIFST